MQKGEGRIPREKLEWKKQQKSYSENYQKTKYTENGSHRNE